MLKEPSTQRTLQAELLIHKLVLNSCIKNTFLSLDLLRSELLKEQQIDVSKSTMHRWMHELDYVYGRKRYVHNPAWKRWAQIRSFIRRYAAALREEQRGEAVIVYMDESFIHEQHSFKRGWYSPSSPTGNEFFGAAKGKRIIIMHAMTRHGMLSEVDVEPSNILTEVYESCALIFDEVCADGITAKDYHDTITGDKFIGWMQNRLFPTVEKLFPGKKIILVLDNAKYHHHRGPDWFTTNNKKKGQLADWLRQRNVESFIADDGREFHRSKFSADATKQGGGPTVEQLKHAVKEHLRDHPGINTTVPQQLMSDKGFILLYTPPYISDLQPIEMIWAFVKDRVAKLNHRKRKKEECAAQTRTEMDNVTPELCQSVVDHVHAWIERFMHSECGGELKQYPTLASLVETSTSLADEMDIASQVDPMSSDDDSNED